MHGYGYAIVIIICWLTFVISGSSSRVLGLEFVAGFGNGGGDSVGGERYLLIGLGCLGVFCCCFDGSGCGISNGFHGTSPFIG